MVSGATPVSSHFFLKLYSLPVEIQHHVVCIDLECILHSGEGAPFSHSIISELAPQLHLQKAIPLLYPADNFRVMRYAIRLVDPVTMHPLLCFLCCKVGTSVQYDICGVWVSSSNVHL